MSYDRSKSVRELRKQCFWLLLYDSCWLYRLRRAFARRRLATTRSCTALQGRCQRHTNVLYIALACVMMRESHPCVLEAAVAVCAVVGCRCCCCDGGGVTLFRKLFIVGRRCLQTEA